MTRSQLSRRRLLGAAAATTTLTAASATRQPAIAAEVATDRPGDTPNTRFAVNIEMWYRDEPTFLDRIRAAHRFGYPAVEFWPYANKPIAEAATLLKDLGVAVSQFTAWGFGTKLNNPQSNQDDFVAAIRESCDIADQLDCSLFTVVIR